MNIRQQGAIFCTLGISGVAIGLLLFTLFAT